MFIVDLMCIKGFRPASCWFAPLPKDVFGQGTILFCPGRKKWNFLDPITNITSLRASSKLKMFPPHGDAASTNTSLVRLAKLPLQRLAGTRREPVTCHLPEPTPSRTPSTKRNFKCLLQVWNGNKLWGTLTQLSSHPGIWLSFWKCF